MFANKFSCKAEFLRSSEVIRIKTEDSNCTFMSFGILMYIGKLVTIKEASKSKVQNKQTKVVLCPIGGKATKLPETYRGK